MDFPNDKKYTKEHEWISEIKGNKASIGVTSYAIEQLGDIVHVELPSVGESFSSGASFGTIESTKTVSDLYMPVGGKVVAVNDRIIKSPESLQEDAYNEGWLVQVEITTPGTELMSSDAYAKFIEQSH